MSDILKFGTPFQQTATGSTAAYASQTGVANTRIYITDISGSSDSTGATITVQDGSTPIWQDRIGTSPYTKSFVTPLKATSGNSVTVAVTGTSVANANLVGVTNNS